MTRFARLMAATMAALFTGALAAPAYATGGGGDCAGHSAVRTFGHSGCKAEGTKFNDLDKDGRRDAGEPGLAGFRIWADYDNDGVHDAGEPYDDTDASGRYAITGINPPSTSAATRTFGNYSKKYRLREKLTTGTGTGDWTCSYPNATTSGGFATGNGSGFRCGHGPIDAKSTPKATGKDFGNYRKAKPKITVVKALVPSSDSGRFDLKVDGVSVKAAAGDGGTGSTLVAPGHHQVTETAAAGTTLADYAASISCLKNGKSAATARTNGPGWVDVTYGDEVVCTVRNVRLGTVEVEKQTDPDETNGTSFGFTSFSGDVQPRRRRRQDVHAHHPARGALRGQREHGQGLPPVVDQLHRRRQHDLRRQPHRQHQGGRGREGPLHVRQHEARPRPAGGQGRPRGGPPRRHDDVHVRGLQHGQLAAARRARDRRPLRRRVLRAGGAPRR